MTPSAIHRFAQDVYGLDIPYSSALEQLIETAMLIGYNAGWQDAVSDQYFPPETTPITHHSVLGETWLIAPSPYDPSVWNYWHEDAESPQDTRQGVVGSPEEAKKEILRRCLKGVHTFPFYTTDDDETILAAQRLSNGTHRAVHYTSADDDVGETLLLGDWQEVLRTLAAKEKELVNLRAEATCP